MDSGKWEVRSGKWEVRSGKWEVGSGKWEVGIENKSYKIFITKRIAYCIQHKANNAK